MIDQIQTSSLMAYFVGPDLSQGPLPALFYFSLSGEESLALEPYNSLVSLLDLSSIRIFSFTIPGHEEGLSKFEAMAYWADSIERGEYLLEEFIEKLAHAIDWLVDQNIVDPSHMVASGLSRGGFIATHLTAKDNRIRALIAFAPLTDLLQIKEFKEREKEPRFLAHIETLNLISLTSDLLHLKQLRFYIGNRDHRVGTDACYAFIKALSEEVHEKRARHMHVELSITSSIGHQGHGTAASTFAESAALITHHLKR